MADSMNQDSLTLEETNKVRLSLGLKPIGAALEEGEEAPPDLDAIAEANFAQRKDEMKRAKSASDIKERIEKAKNQHALNSKLKGDTLAAKSKDDALDAASWIKKLKKRQKAHEKDLAAKRQREMEEADRAVDYDETDLTGLKVAHGAEEFNEGEEIVLTLKDSRVLAGEEDELQNVNMVDDAAVKAAKERKRKAMEQYTGYDDEEFDEDRIGKKADILGKYDDEFSTGKARSEGFRLGAVTKDKKMDLDEEDEGFARIGQAPATKVKLNLDYAKEFDVSDYAKEGEAGFKKAKKKKVKRSTRKADGDEDDMEVEGEPTFTRRNIEDTPQNLVDDDDLQAALARTRRENSKKKPKLRPEEVAAQIAQRRVEDEGNVPVENGDEDGRITFDDTSEFVRNVNLESRAVTVKRERAASPKHVVVKIERGDSTQGVTEQAEASSSTAARVEDEDEAMDSEDEDEALAEMAAREGLSLEEYRLKIDAQLQEMGTLKPEDPDDPTEDAVKGAGVANFLSLLRNQGSLKSGTAEDAERERLQKAKDLWLADHRTRMAKREMEKILARGGNKDQAQREWEGKIREQTEAREALDMYRDYKPDINIVYHDEYGREMTPKEAWKSLSHKFHGKTSGRMKTDKRLKKIAEERKQLTMNSGDTPLGMTDAFARRQQKTGEAHMVLSVGNKGSVQVGNGKGKSKR